MEYLDFDLRISSGSDRMYPIAVMRSPAGEARGTMRFPFEPLALDYHLRELERAALRSAPRVRQVDVSDDEEEEKGEGADREVMLDFGTQLFEALFTSDVRDAFRRSHDRARSESRGLRVRLRIEAPELSSLPWEFMYDPSERDYICLSADTPLVRYLESAQPPVMLTVPPPLRMLVMIANPESDAGGAASLDLSRERERIEQATRTLRERNYLKVDWMEGSTFRHLQRALRQRDYNIFHFAGHGNYDATQREGTLIFTDESGEAAPIGANDVGRLLSTYSSMRLAVLNCCQGSKGSERDVVSSTSTTLVARGVPAVVGMQFRISDRGAIEFSRSLYEAIADGLPIDAAVAEARNAMRTSVRSSAEWGTPVLHMRSPDGVLFRLDGVTPGVRTTGNFVKLKPPPQEPVTIPVAEESKAQRSRPPDIEQTPVPRAPRSLVSPPSPVVDPPAQKSTISAPDSERTTSTIRRLTPPRPIHNADGAPGRRVAMIAGGVAVLLAIAAGAYFLRPTPGLVARTVVFSSFPDTIVRDGEGTARYNLTMSDGRTVTGAEQISAVLEGSGDKVILKVEPGAVLSVAADSANAAFVLHGLTVGSSEIWPVIVRQNGDSIPMRERRSVVVKEPTETVLLAIQAFNGVKVKVEDDSVTDSALLAQLHATDSLYGDVLRGPGGYGAELASLVQRTSALIATRGAADSVGADTNATMQEQYLALKAYRDSAAAVRRGHGPSQTDVAAQLATLHADVVGTVPAAGLGPAKNESTQRQGRFRVGSDAWIFARYTHPSDRRAHIEWRRNGRIVKPSDFRPTPPAVGWRTWDMVSLNEAGNWEVRVRNGARQLLFRLPFVVE